MKYNRYEIGPYNLHVINTDNFKRNVISINFKRKVSKEELTKRTFLSTILIRSSLNYKTEKDIAIACEDLYDLKYSSISTISGNYAVMSFELTFLSDKYTEEGNTKKCLNFLSETLFNPNVTNKQFDKKTFDLVKEELKTYLENLDESPQRMASKILLGTIDSKEPYSFEADGYLEDLEKITNKELYDYYLQVLRSDLVDIFVVGGFEDKIKDTIVKIFKVNTIKKPVTTHYVTHKTFRRNVKVKKVKKDINQSILKIGFKVDNLSDIERKYATNIYNYILSGGSDSKLFKNVREKHSLCYQISSSFRQVYNLLIITAGIDAKNFKKCVSLIKKELKNIEKGRFKEEDINAAKAIYKSALMTMQDSAYNIIGFYRAKEYLGLDTVETRLEEIEKVNKEMIIKVAKKTRMDTILLLEGEDNEQD